MTRREKLKTLEDGYLDCLIVTGAWSNCRLDIPRATIRSLKHKTKLISSVLSSMED